MSIGKSIRKARKFRGYTQKQLGVKLGFSEQTAETRIGQYESNARKPKEFMIQEFATLLNVNADFFKYAEMNSVDHIIHCLLNLDDFLDIEVDGNKIAIASNPFNSFLVEFQKKKQELQNKEITKSEYTDWKLRR